FKLQWPTDFSGFTEVWLIGGDGTLNYLINAYPDVQLPLALFKGGSGNDFHWLLYDQVSLLQQVEKVLRATPRRMDAGICNGRLFLNGVGIGFDGAIVKDLDGKEKWLGRGTYFFPLLKYILTYKECSYAIILREKRIEESCFMISIANGKRYGGGFLVAPHAVPHDQLLDVTIIKRIAVHNRLRYLPVVKQGKYLHLPFVQVLQTQSIIIEANNRVPAHVDGEFFRAETFFVKLLPERFSFLW
ncbi:MAG: hypothetical protein ICV81_02825, partial [Flavisolibacter sp.]|nr:hypothetical protein [Flavisolibacter sp.]